MGVGGAVVEVRQWQELHPLTLSAVGDDWERESPHDYHEVLGSLRGAMLAQVEGQIEDAAFKLSVLKRAQMQEDGKNVGKLAKAMQRTRK